MTVEVKLGVRAKFGGLVAMFWITLSRRNVPETEIEEKTGQNGPGVTSLVKDISVQGAPRPKLSEDSRTVKNYLDRGKVGFYKRHICGVDPLNRFSFCHTFIVMSSDLGSEPNHSYGLDELFRKQQNQ
ncbi:hypothetical protein PAAG_04404 [Paracoccidioides lutzii Pb01]|uniref:Uncharacterized protein n=1 Tax=Paracoccidioides lutzii (strain ATCC MYA-826 / Pb01) TaxID=502779 RepID=C1H0W0_PARBA|nr:hypothetical protein PAAG_04404 [Paracoccidioides lutzii Pb01]EEH33354.2 hypothetical protein PAAG_04404 [Paracoccidioides lutzii Pb01]